MNTSAKVPSSSANERRNREGIPLLRGEVANRRRI
jgi:hypothetical protein